MPLMAVARCSRSAVPNRRYPTRQPEFSTRKKSLTRQVFRWCRATLANRCHCIGEPAPAALSTSCAQQRQHPPPWRSTPARAGFRALLTLGLALHARRPRLLAAQLGTLHKARDVHPRGTVSPDDRHHFEQLARLVGPACGHAWRAPVSRPTPACTAGQRGRKSRPRGPSPQARECGPSIPAPPEGCPDTRWSSGRSSRLPAPAVCRTRSSALPAAAREPSSAASGKGAGPASCSLSGCARSPSTPASRARCETQAAAVLTTQHHRFPRRSPAQPACCPSLGGESCGCGCPASPKHTSTRHSNPC